MAESCHGCGSSVSTVYACRKCDHEFCGDCRVPAYHDCTRAVETDGGRFGPDLSGFSVFDHVSAVLAGLVGGVLVAEAAGALGFVFGFFLLLPFGYLRRWWMNRKVD